MFRYSKGPNGSELKKAHETDAGFDVCSSENKMIAPGEKALIGTDLTLELPEGYYGRIASRSGLAVKKDIEVGAGVIDFGFKGELMSPRVIGLLNWSLKKSTRGMQTSLTQ